MEIQLNITYDSLGRKIKEEFFSNKKLIEQKEYFYNSLGYLNTGNIWRFFNKKIST